MKKKNKVDYDAVVIGAGMAGVSIALALGELGKKVLVIDRKGIRGQSSPAAGGILDPMLEMKPGSPLFKLSQQAFQNYPSFVSRLQKITKRDVGYLQTGMLYVALDPKQREALWDRYVWQKKTSIPVRWLKRSEILRRYPYLSENSLDGLFYPTIGRVHPKKLLETLKTCAKKFGVRFIEARKNVRIVIQNKKISGVKLNGRKTAAPILINAAGAWAGRLGLPGIQPQIMPVRGQIVIYESKHWTCRTILHTVDGGYLVPWEKNRYLTGSTVEHAGFNAKVTSQGKASILRKVAALIPDVKRFKIKKSWAGLRPCPNDSLPWIGQTGINGLYLAAGYYRSGILISPLVGKLLARQILTGKVSGLLKPFDPSRRFKRTAL